MRPRSPLPHPLLALTLSACAAATPPPPHSAPSVCPHDATPSVGACQCAPGLSVLDGACVGPRQLDAYCGASGVSGGACMAPLCAPDDAVDLSAGACVSAQRARDLVGRVRPVPDDLKLACHEGRALAVRGDTVACVPSGDLCPRGSDWDPKGARCAPIAACRPGELRASAGPCVPLLSRGRDGAPVVDIGRWAGLVLGTDGGEGTARLCRPLAQQAAELGVGPGSARTVLLAIELVFPDNDVTLLSARVVAPPGGSADGVRAGQKALDGLLGPLRALGGVSDAASATFRVRCAVEGGGTPSLVPR